jgi:16S rRNA (cytidine1402-2'-O)-methyltransferase
LTELAAWAADGVLGEITVVLAGATPRADLPVLVAEVEAVAAAGVRVKDACSQVAEAHRELLSRRELYEAVLRSRQQASDDASSASQREMPPTAYGGPGNSI